MSDGAPISAMDISTQALTAQRQRMTVLAGNIANANTLVTGSGEPYRKREVTFASVMQDVIGSDDPSAGLAGVEARVSFSKDPFIRELRPGHPLADKDGFVQMPNINVTEEMVELVAAQRAYEANLAAVKVYRDMLRNSLSILRR